MGGFLSDGAAYCLLKDRELRECPICHADKCEHTAQEASQVLRTECKQMADEFKQEKLEMQTKVSYLSVALFVTGVYLLAIGAFKAFGWWHWRGI